MVALDIVNFISIISPFCLCFKSKKGKRLRIVSKRRRQNLLAASFLFIMGGGVYMGMSAQHLPTDKPPSRRKLLGVFLNHHAEFLGYALGLLSFAINWTARFPSFLKARRGEMNSAVHMSSGVLCVLAGALYSTAVVLHDQQLGFILRAMPWLLAAACCAVLDLSVSFLKTTCGCLAELTYPPSVYDVHQKPPYVRPLGSEMESLLRNSSHCAKNKPKGKAINKPLAQSNTYKMTDMGQYMDVNVQPGRKVCLKEVRISQDGQLACQTVKRTERVIRVDGPYSSNSSSDTSTLNSELEWDFEEANQQWIKNNKVSRDAEPAEAFPLQEWVTSPQAEADPRSGSHICLCNRARLAERMVSREPLDLSLTVSDSAK
ncbi:transmembrane protein 44 [Chanos chanos]|uniref:Transmembrane protein 44 n=1 Tax=Chanos chanos TaxID=29144 RepID=A0A6J2WS08_CHACN|nr:transmembrane protein 44 [Chanos chanos]